ncbi:MAG: radical SAM protein [Candidatus Margulisiibacteriota bacterium]
MKTLIESILPLVRKPARYIGNELNSIHKDWDACSLRIALAYPDLYEIGMSNLGLQILYHILNSQDDVLAERVYAPAQDMEEKLRENKLSLFSLESWKPLKDFDLIGFGLGHELTYTNLINMLELSGIPIYAKDRTDEHPLIFAGGPCAFNPEPIADFVDFFVIGEAEEVILEMLNTLRHVETRGGVLEKLAKLDGVYVPGISTSVKKRYVKDIDAIPVPTRPIVPFLRIVHDRAMVEIMRGCKRACKFCSAFEAYKPVRMRSPEKIKQYAYEILKNTGFDELSLVSLSSSDYKEIEPLAKELSCQLARDMTSLSLPSLRLDSFGVKLAKDISRVRVASVTAAPEAGTQRLRDLVGKDLSEEEILKGARVAFEEGVTNLKLYFMIGLPTETEEDVAGIVDLARRILQLGQEKSKRAHVTVSVSTFIPKPHTPLERERMISFGEIIEKQKYLKDKLRGRGLELRWHDANTSILEGVFSRGDRNLARVIEHAWQLGARLDAWSEHFRFDLWQQAFGECGVDMNDYLKAREPQEQLPWEHISCSA